MRRLLIADINSWCVNGISHGHYMPVARNFLEIFAKCDVDVKVVGGPLYKKYFNEGELIVLPYNAEPGSGVVRKFHNIINLWRLFSIVKKDDVLVFQSSACATVFWGIALLAKKHMSIYLIQYCPKENLSTWFKRLGWRLAKNKIIGLIGPNDEVGKAFGKPVIVVPDYIYVKSVKEDTVPAKFDFAICGTITPKKGAIEAARVLAEAGMSVLVAGRASPQGEAELKRIAAAYGKVGLRLGYLTEDDFSASVVAGKMTVLNYTNAYSDQSSGVVYDSLFRLRPVLGRRCKALQFIEDEGLGILYDNLSAVDFKLVLDEKNLMEMKERIKIFLRKQSLYAKALRQICGDY